MGTKRILAVVTNASDYEKAGYRTGLWLGELTHFQDAVEKAGFSVDIASPEGGYVPIDPESLAASVLKDGGTAERYEDPAYMKLLQESLPLTDVDVDAYDAIYLAGGHGTMFDFRGEPLASVIGRFAAAGKVVSAVCHGPAGLLDARGADGTPLVAGKKVTGFSWAEEKLAQRQDAVPFNLQDELSERGGDYTKALLPFGKKVVTDGLLITGQNPGSAEGVAEAVVEALKD